MIYLVRDTDDIVTSVWSGPDGCQEEFDNAVADYDEAITNWINQLNNNQHESYKKFEELDPNPTKFLISPLSLRDIVDRHTNSWILWLLKMFKSFDDFIVMEIDELNRGKNHILFDAWIKRRDAYMKSSMPKQDAPSIRDYIPSKFVSEQFAETVSD